MPTIKEAAAVLPSTKDKKNPGRSLQKRIVNTTLSRSGRLAWANLSTDPDEIPTGVNDEFTLDMAEVLGIEHPSKALLDWGKDDSLPFPTSAIEIEGSTEEEIKAALLEADDSIEGKIASPYLAKAIAAPATKTVPAKPIPTPRRRNQAKISPSKYSAQGKAKRSTKSRKVEIVDVPTWLMVALVACAPIAEGYSFARIGHLNYGLDLYGQLGWAFIGYVAGLIVFVNYVRIDKHLRAELWAGLLAALQLLTHMAASDWNWDTMPASLLIVACSWAINAAYKRK